MTFLLTDFLARDILKDDLGRFRWEVELGLFREAVHTKKEMEGSEVAGSSLRRVSVGEILDEVSKSAKENMEDKAVAGVLAELDSEEVGQIGESRERRKIGEYGLCKEAAGMRRRC